MKTETKIDHYVATISIEVVSNIVNSDGSGSYQQVVSVTKQTEDVMHFVLRADDLAGLRLKLQNHMDLI